MRGAESYIQVLMLHDVFQLVIQAMDAINTTLLSRRTLIVELIDEDDNQASFTRSDYAACPNDVSDLEFCL